MRSAIAKATALLGYKLSKDVFVCLPAGIDSVDIKSAFVGV